MIQTKCLLNGMKKVLDSHYIYTQLSVMSMEFLNTLVVCWKQNFVENGEFLKKLEWRNKSCEGR
jgi:hypothetical protein